MKYTNNPVFFDIVNMTHSRDTSFLKKAYEFSSVANKYIRTEFESILNQCITNLREKLLKVWQLFPISRCIYSHRCQCQLRLVHTMCFSCQIVSTINLCFFNVRISVCIVSLPKLYTHLHSTPLLLSSVIHRMPIHCGMRHTNVRDFPSRSLGSSIISSSMIWPFSLHGNSCTCTTASSLPW